MAEGASEKKEERKAEELFIFSEEDLRTVQQLKYGVIVKPLQFLAVSSALVLLAKKANLRRLIANPFHDEQLIKKNDKYWKYATLNGIVVGTIGFATFAFHRCEINKILLYKKYEKEIGMYMKWRLDREIVRYLSQ